MVTTPGGSSASNALYTYVAIPSVTSITPSRGSVAGGTSVTIAGIALGGATKVTMNQAQSGVVLGYNALTALPVQTLLGVANGVVFLLSGCSSLAVNGL